MNETVVRAAGLGITIVYASLIAWLFVRQPATFAEVTGGLSSAVGAYRIDQQAFDDGLRYFRNDQFAEARAAFERADPARRDALTQFYIGYAFYREGWGRFYSDDRLYRRRTRGGEPRHRARAGRAARRRGAGTGDPDRRRVEGGARTGPEGRGIRFQPGASGPSTQMTAAREAIYLPVLFLTVTLLGGLRPGAAVVLTPPSLFSLILAVLLVGVLVQSGAFVPLRVMNAIPAGARQSERRRAGGGAARRRRRRCSRCSRRTQACRACSSASISSS